MDIILNPTRHQWDDLADHCDHPHVNQSWTWGEVYCSVPHMYPLRLLAISNGKPVGMLQAFEWKKWGLSLGIVSGESGGGGGPVIRKDLDKEMRGKIYQALIIKLFQIFKEKKSLRFLLYTFPGDTLPVPSISAKTDWKTTPIITLPESPEFFLQSFHHNERRKMYRGEKKGLVIATGTRSDLPEYYELHKNLVRERNLCGKHVNTLHDLQRIWDILNGNVKLFVGRKDGRMVGALWVQHFKRVCKPHGSVTTPEGKRLCVSNALHGQAMINAIREGCRFYNFSGATRDTLSPMYPITVFKLSFGAELVDFRRYSAIGNRYLNFVIDRIRRILGYSFWFPLPTYP